mmetsp:Transcript_9911/g.24390  ORF Transcript_9911/g.24390 Transcript_9911/m.24390 type:complete len:383 (-) Transcript_9911:51-1199(-)
MAPMTEYFPVPPSPPSPRAAMKLVGLANQAGRGRILLVASGGLRGEHEADAILALARHWEVPLFTDTTAYNLRLLNKPGVKLCSDGDELALRLASDPESLVVLFGDRFVSKSLLQSLGKARPKLVQISPFNGREDPNHLVRLRIQADIHSTCYALLNYPPVKPGESKKEGHTTSAGRANLENMDMDEEKALSSERDFVSWICSNINGDAGILFAGNSMPIRYIDRHAPRTYGPGSREKSFRSPPQICANRGASGIDGVLSTALGVQRATGRHVVLIVGDLSFLHDVGALKLASSHSITIVLLNNDGGVIFKKLPVFEQKHVFREYFQAPHGITSFRPVAEQFGLKYTQMANVEDLLSLQERLQAGGIPDSAAVFELTIHDSD